RRSPLSVSLEIRRRKRSRCVPCVHSSLLVLLYPNLSVFIERSWDRTRACAAHRLVALLKTEFLRPLKTRCDEPPHKKDYYRHSDCANEAGALVSLIPPDRLAKVRCYKRSDYPEHGRPDVPGGLILISRINQFRDHPSHKPNYNRPKNMAHCISLLSCEFF